MDGETTTVSEEPGARARTIRRFLLLLLFVAVAATVGFLLAPTDVAAIRDWSADAGWTGVLLFGIAYAALTLTPVPKNVLGIAAGLVWGFPVALAVVYLGALCGAAASFWIGRALGREAVERFTGARVARLAHGVREGQQVVRSEDRLGELAAHADDAPPARCRQPLRVVSTQVVRVRLGVRGERTQDDGPVSVGVGQRGDGGTSATGLRATTGEAHDRGL